MSDPVDSATYVDGGTTMRASGGAVAPEAPSGTLELGAILGEGAMGVVRSAEQVALHRQVAVKAVRDAADATGEAALYREAWVTGRLEHPNIVPVHDLRVGDSGQALMVLKRIEGVSWQAILDEVEPIPQDGRADPFAWHFGVLAQICNAVEFAHDNGILHRDLKPENVMVGRFGEVYLLDWGLAIGLHPDPSGRIPDVSSDLRLCGTPAYMAPEMFEIGVPLGPATDVYLLGGLLYRVLAGVPPNSGDDLETHYRSSVELPPFVASWSDDLKGLLSSCLARNPEERPSVAALRTALRRHLERRDAERVLRQGLDGIDRVRALLSADADHASVVRVYDLYGASRFAIEEALKAQPDDPRARAAQRELAELMVRHELDRGSPHAALHLLEQVPELDAALRDEVRDQVAGVEDRQRRLADLEVDISARTRAWGRIGFSVLLVSSWLGLPIAFALAGIERSIPRILVQNGIVLAVVVFGAIVFRHAVSGSRLNRGILALTLLSPVLGSVGALLMLHLDTPAHTATIVRVGIDAELLVVAGVLLDRRVMPAALVFSAAVILSAFFPTWTDVLLIGSTVFLAGIVLLAWTFSALGSPDPSA